MSKFGNYEENIKDVVNVYQDSEQDIRRMRGNAVKWICKYRLNKTDSELVAAGKRNNKITSSSLIIKDQNAECVLLQYIKDFLMMYVEEIQAWMEDTEDRSNIGFWQDIDPEDDIQGRMYSIFNDCIDCDKVAIILGKFVVENHRHLCKSDAFCVVDVIPYNQQFDEIIDFHIK